MTTNEIREAFLKYFAEKAGGIDAQAERAAEFGGIGIFPETFHGRGLYFRILSLVEET